MTDRQHTHRESEYTGPGTHTAKVMRANYINYSEYIYTLIHIISMNMNMIKVSDLYFRNTRSSGRYAPFLLAPAEGWGPSGP